MTDWWTDSPRAVDSEDSGAWWEVAPIVGGDEQEPDAPIDDSEQPPLIGPVSELLPFDAPAGRPRALLSDLPLDEDPVGGIGAALQPEPEEESSQPVSDLGKRAARGFVEVGAALPEALAIAGAGNPNASALFASEEITRSEEQIALAEKRLLDVPETDQETRLRIQDVISAEQRKIESYTPLRDIAEGPLKPDAQDRPLYKSGDAIRQVSEELFGTPDPRFDDRFMSKLAEGGGNMVGFVGVTLATGLIGGGVAGSSLNTSSMYKRAIQDGATEDQAKTAAYIGSVIGASEVLPIGSALKMLPTPVRNKVQGALARRMTNAFMSAGEEGLQEAMAETANNLTVKGVYNPDQKIFQGVTEAALIGGILGGGMGALAPTGGDGGTASTPTTQALIDKHATQEDHDSPTDTGLISEGKEQIEQMLNPSAQTIAPETPTNLPDGASPMALLSPEAENSPQRGTPEAPQASDEGLAPQRPEQPQRPAIGDSIAPMQPVPTEDEILPLFEDGVDTGKRARINPKTGAMEIVQEPDQAPAKPLAPANVDAQTTDPVQPAISPAVQELVDGGAEIILNGQKVPRSPAAGGLQAASSPDQATTIPQQPVQETDAQIQEAAEAQSLLETQDLGPDLAQRATPRAVEILSNEDLTNIETDAETFQYKSDGDSEGVTDRLRGVKKWDTTRAGSAIVFERADGSRVIADGHQRLGLAKRMRAEGQEVEMPVIIRREVDGWTAKDVMVQAALKNIGEVPIKGTPDPQQVVDAAKIMRAVPEMTAEIMDLPKASALARDAQRVRDLSDDAFGMLVNERASVRNAAAVGKTVKDKSAHANILQLLEKLKPENIFQSEQIARQAAAETTVETQDSLFGEEEITESLFLERARVMDVAIKRLRKDKATFNTLLQRGETIVGAGNVLDQDANKTRMNEDATVQEYLTRQANTKGPISDALSTAAKTVKEGGNIGQTVTGFIGHVRAGLAEDSQASQARPVSGRAVEPGPEGQAASASDSGQSGFFPSDEGRSPQKNTNDRGVLESGPEEQVTAPTAETETTPPTFEEFRTQLPKDSDGYADVIGAGQKAIDQASGKSGVKWADLGDDGKKSAFQSVGGELQVSDDAAATPTVPPAAPAVPVPESAAPKEPNVSTNGPTGVEYPNRKLGFKYARSQDGGLEGGALGNIALSNMQVGEIIPGHGEITSITEKQIRVTGEGGKKKIISVEGNKFDQLSRDMTGLIEGSQHGVDAGDVLTALKRDPAFSYDENQIPQLSDTARGGKEGPNTAGILKPLAPVLDVNPHDQWYDGLTDDEQVTLHQKMGVSGLDWDKQSTDKKQAIHGEFKSVNLDPFPDAPTQTEQTPEGEQALIEGVKPITQKERLEAQMNKAKDGGNAAPPSGRGDLFGDPMDRADLFDANKTEQLPVGDQVQGVFNAALRAFRGAMDAYTKDNKQDVTPGNVLFTKMVEKADSSPEYRVKLRDWMAGKGSTIELRNIAEDFGSYWTDQGFSKAVDSLDSIQASLASQPKIGEGIKNGKVKSLPENNNLQDKGARKSKLDQERLGEVSSLGNTNENKETDTGTAMFSVPGKLDTFAAEFTTELAANDEVFRFPKAKSGNLKGAMAEINPETKYIGEMSDPDLRKEKGIDARHLLRTNKDTDFYVYENEDEAWIDVSRLGEGEGGNAVYAAVADYAFNTGREFIGDPDGLSDIALRRRTDAMLSSAFKHGTTKHLKPHQRQLDGDTALGVPAMKWVADDHVANMEEMIRVSVENIAHFVPEIKRARYDFKTGTFRTHQGKPLHDETLQQWSDTHPRIRAAGAGRRTIKRVILFNTLSHAPSGERSGLLEQVLRRDDQLVTEGDLKGIFYSKPDAKSESATTADIIGEADTAAQTNTSPDVDPRYSATTQGGDVTGELTPRFVEKAEKVARDLRLRAKKYGLGKMEVEVLGRIFGRMQDGSMTPVDGAFIDKVIFVALNSSEGATTTFDHEVIHALRSPQMWGKDHGLFKPAEWKALEARAKQEADMIADLQDTYREDQITEEVVARLYSQWAAGDLQAKGFLRTAFERIQRIIEALGNAMRGNGFVTADSVFQKVSKGEIGARQGDVLQEVSEPRFSVPKKKQSTFTDGMDSPHIPDRKMYDALHDSNLSLKAKVQESRHATRDQFDKIRVKVQDRMLPLLRMEQAVGEARGRDVSKDESPYFAEERFFSKVGRRLDEVDETFTAPVIDMIAKQNYLKNTIALKDAKGKLREGMDAVSLFLYARHAQERNTRIASINEGKQDGGSGMTNAEAKAIIARAENGKHAKVLNQIGVMSDQLVQDTINLRENAGLLSAKEAHMWRTMYKHYVPLKGFAETDLSEASLDVTGAGRRFNIKGGEAKTAMGRGSEAFDPLTALITQAQEVAIRAEKNSVGQSMLKFAQENPAPDMYEIAEAEPKRFINKATGMVETHFVSPTTRQQFDNEMSVKMDGKEYRIQFHDPRLAKALGNVGADQMGWLLQKASKFSRYFSSINTMLSPPFIIKNAIRDMTAAQINLGAFGGKDANAIRKAILKNWGYSFIGGYRAMQGKMDTKHAKLYREFEEAGGKVSFWKMEQPEAGRSDIQKRIDLDSSRQGKLRKGGKLNTRDNPFLNWIERVNLAVDNSVRLSSYVEARKKGWSKSEAASLAKNLTVNFNRRGEMGAGMNALYPFANAAIQGTEVLFRAMKSNQVKGLAGGLFIAGMVQDYMNAALSDDDEDGETGYDKIPNYVSERNIVLMPGTEFALTIPLPYGFNIFYYAGQQTSKMMRRVKKPGEVSADVLLSMFGAFSPLNGQTLQQSISPTLLDFTNELAQNEDWTGRNIRPESEYADFGPKAYRHNRNVNPISREIAYGLNKATGGSSVRSGAIDFSPEYIDHTVNFLTGGMGRFVSKSAGLATNLATGQKDEIQLSGVPFVRNYFYSPNEWLDRNRYFEFAGKVQEANYSSKISKETGDPLSGEQKLQAKLYEALKGYEKKREKHKADKNAIHSNSRLSIGERNLKLKPLYKKENKLFLDFNEKYVKALGRQGE